MVTNKDWETAHREVLERGRKRVGDPPSPEELVAYSQGDLSPAEEERIRQKLAYYPDLAAALTDDNDAFADDTPLLTKAELAADWNAIRKRVGPAIEDPVTTIPAYLAKRRTGMWQWATAASFLIIALTGGLYLRSTSTIRALREELRRPRGNVERIVLVDETERGTAHSAIQSITLHAPTEYVVIALTLEDESQVGPFRAEMRNLETEPPQVIWTGSVRRGSDGTFMIEMPRGFLGDRRHRIQLFVEDESRPIATYAFALSSD